MGRLRVCGCGGGDGAEAGESDGDRRFARWRVEESGDGFWEMAADAVESAGKWRTW